MDLVYLSKAIKSSVQFKKPLSDVENLEEKFKSVDEILLKKTLSPFNVQELVNFVALIRSIELSSFDEDIMDVHDDYIEFIEERMTNVFFHGHNSSHKRNLHVL